MRRANASRRGALRRIAHGLGATAALGLTSCATYQPPAGPDAATATLQIDPQTVTLRLINVDGLALTAAGAFLNPFSGREAVKLAPGPHYVGIQYSWGDAYRRYEGTTWLDFEVVAGRQYRVHERHDATRFLAWITDDSGKTVSRPRTR